MYEAILQEDKDTRRLDTFFSNSVEIRTEFRSSIRALELQQKIYKSTPARSPSFVRELSESKLLGKQVKIVDLIKLHDALEAEHMKKLDLAHTKMRRHALTPATAATTEGVSSKKKGVAATATKRFLLGQEKEKIELSVQVFPRETIDKDLLGKLSSQFVATLQAACKSGEHSFPADTISSSCFTVCTGNPTTRCNYSD